MVSRSLFLPVDAGRPGVAVRHAPLGVAKRPAAACPTTPEPTPAAPKRHRPPSNLLRASPKLHSTPVSHGSDLRPGHTPPPPHRAHAGDDARWTPPPIFARTPTVPIAAGSAGAISAPMAMFPPRGPWRQLLCIACRGDIPQPSARSPSCQASRFPSSPSYASLARSAEGLGIRVRHECSMLDPTRSCSLVASSCGPSHSTSCMTCGSGRCNWMSCLLSSVRSRTLHGQRGRNHPPSAAVFAPVGLGGDGPGEQAAAAVSGRDRTLAHGPMFGPPRRARPSLRRSARPRPFFLQMAFAST